MGSKGDENACAIFRVKVPASGKYSLLMAYSPHESRAKQVPLMVSNGSKEVTFSVNQTLPLPQGELFQPVGTLELSADFETTLRITAKDTVGFVIVDSLQLLPIK